VLVATFPGLAHESAIPAPANASWGPLERSVALNLAGRSVEPLAIPGQIIPGEIIPTGAVPRQVVPGQLIPGQVVPRDTVPRQVVPGGIVPIKGSPREESPYHAAKE